MAQKIPFSVSFFTRILLVLGLWIGVTVPTQAQVSAYTVQQLAAPAANTAGYWTTGANFNTNNNGVAAYGAGINVDDAIIPVTFGTLTNGAGFQFTYRGANQTAVNISTNGHVYFGTTTGTPATEYNPISSTVTTYSAGAIAVYARDLDLIGTTATGINIFYGISGTAPNRIFKVMWVVRRSNGANSFITTPTAETSMIMQLWLYETTGVIEMYYQPTNFGSQGTISQMTGQIGLRGNSVSDFNMLSYQSHTAPWPSTSMAQTTTNNALNVFTSGNSATLTATIQTASNRLFRWTPVTCPSPGTPNITDITHNSATLNWTAPSPAPALGYEYYVGTSMTPTVTNSTTGLTTGPLSLASGQTYYFAVRSVCSGSDSSAWTTLGSFQTYCAVNVPYYIGFDGAGIASGAPDNDLVTIPGTTPFHGGLPFCTRNQNLASTGVGNPWVTSDESRYTNIYMDFQGNFLMYNGQAPSASGTANTWFFTKGVNLTAGTSYRLQYLYSGTDNPPTALNRMRVSYGTLPFAANMSTQLDDKPEIKGGPSISIVNFVPATSGVYYFGFNCYSNPNNGQLAVDDISVDLSVCLRPTNVSVASITATTALLSWTAPTPAPSNGYVYYVSTSPTTPSYSQAPTGATGPGVTVTTITGLTGSTTYYVWVRTNCGGGDFGEWVALNNAGNPFFTTLPPPPAYCTPSGASFPQDPNGITNVTIGSINNTTGIETNNYGNYSNLVTIAPQGEVMNCSITYATGFTYDTNIWVDWNNDGDFADAGELVYQGVSTNAIPTTLNASFTVPLAQPLGPVRMRIGGIDFGPFTDPCRNGNYQAFEDYTLNVVVAPPPLAINISSTTQCAGDCSPLISITTALGNYNTYTWSPPLGVTGTAATGYTICSNTSITYTLTGVQTFPPFSTRSVTFRYNANTRPTPITITTPSGTNVCSTGPAIPINTSGGLVSGFPILNEGFNGATNTWTVAGTGSGAPIANWTLRPNNFAGPLGAIRSNDNTQFYLADSDEPGSGTSISTTLTSPAINTVGYTTLGLSFWHCYRFFSGDSGRVQASIDGVTWTDLSVYSSNQGGLTAFNNVIINLDAYINQPTLFIRFRYDATWDWFWAIDNVLVSGTANSSVTWSPAAGLFTDAAATTPYVAGTGAATVYALPTTTTTYTASASTLAPVCTTSTNVTINVTTVNAGTAGPNQTICDGAPANLTLTGHVGTILRWQYASDLAFTTPVDIPASATATLTSAQMGTLTATRYYRAVVSFGGCTAFSTVVTITFDATTWNGSAWSNGLPSLTKAAIFAGNFTSTGNLSACSATVQSGTVVINPGHTLTVQNAVNVVGGSLTFEDTSSLLQNTNAVNSGNITYRRNTTPMRKFDYTYWSSPVAPQTLVGLSPLTLSDKYFTFNPVIGNWVNVAGNSLMDAGKGYIIRAPNNFDVVTPSVFNASFFGVPNNGPISVPIVLGASDVNLIGNPYPSAVDIDLFMDLNGDTGTNVVDKTIYIWTHNTPMTNNNYTNSDYAVYNYMGGVGTAAAPGPNSNVPNGNIASGQSFFIKGLSAGTALFNNSMRITGNNNQFFRSAEDKSRIWLQIYDGAAGYKQALVGYAHGATDGIDSGYDGDLFASGTPVSIYSLVGSHALTIQGRALPFEDTDVIPLGYSATAPGNLTIGLHNFDGLFEAQNIYLKDKVLQVLHDLKSSDYAFTSAQGTFNDRFELVFTNSALSTPSLEFDQLVVVYVENGVIRVKSSLNALQKVDIYDIRGALLGTQSATGLESSFSNSLFAQQILLVKVTDEFGNTLTRKIQYP
ncbi:Fibronectin type III domain-containing protein [Flavobacterium fontis]|uniref:Fibronectin type III domain-containing protein n=1 Tax=Flavobacterium fontis TaxID=1124188 RepID=A0A1M4XC89_9FLAO|nr:GEVED domain-containing protein [Flavobacterium fontis]SHE91157.1 Fibronectin type III domain-containing protein [Flavobacterium fontis]